jgi:CheY-like chemotaxis protein
MEAVEHLIEPGLGQSQGGSASSKREAVFTPTDAALSMRRGDGVIVTGRHKAVRPVSPGRSGPQFRSGTGGRMFDGTLKTRQDEGSELARLRALYDGLLEPAPAEISDAARVDLDAMARIFDLDAERPAAGVWRDLRAVLTRQAVPLQAGDEAMAPTTPPLTIMVVEDDPVTAADLMDVLVEAGHGVVGPFSDPAAAITAAGLHGIDLALVDINLIGDGDGLALARALKETWGVPVMFLSGDVAAAARHARLATALVLKPYGRRDVLAAIARAVDSGAVAA